MFESELKFIPKIIHYCWFGKNKYSLTIKRCIASWQYHLPEYEFILWNEENFDITANNFTKEAYSNKKFAFVSDYVRMHALSEQGGIYLDTDVELFKPLDTLLEYDFFIGLEDTGRFGTSTIGSVSKHWLSEKMLEIYNETPFSVHSMKDLVNVNIVSKLLLEHGFSHNNNLEVISNQAKFPISSFGGSIKSNTLPDTIYARHLYNGSWKNSNKSELSKLSKYIFKGGALSDIYSIAKIIEFKIKQKY